MSFLLVFSRKRPTCSGTEHQHRVPNFDAGGTVYSHVGGDVQISDSDASTGFSRQITTLR